MTRGVALAYRTFTLGRTTRAVNDGDTDHDQNCCLRRPAWQQRGDPGMLEDIDAHSVDQVYSLGDLVGYGAKPNETIALIRERNISIVMGNYDDGVGFDRDDCGCAYKDAGEHERNQQSLFWTRQHTSDGP